MLQHLIRSRQTVGLDIGSRVLKAAQLNPSGKAGYELISLGFEELLPDCIVNGEVISKSQVSEAITRLFSEQDIRMRQTSTSISGHSVIVKRISLPVQCRENLQESLRWEAEQHIPFDISDVNLDSQILSLNAETGTLDILLVAGKKDKVNDYAGVIKMAGKTPVLVDVDAFALQNSYVFNYEPAGRSIVVLLDIGASTMTINIAAGVDILYTRNVAIAHHTNQPATEIVCHEIQKTYDSVESTKTASHIDRIIGSGGGIHSHGLIEALAHRFSAPVEKFNSFKKIAFNPNRFPPALTTERAPDFAIATGLALRTAGSGFLPRLSAKTGKRLWKAVGIYGSYD